MGYGRICSKAVYAVFLGSDIDGDDAKIKFQYDKYSDMVTVTGPSGSAAFDVIHTVGEKPDHLYLGEFGTDDQTGYYIICGRTHLGGGIWCDGGSFSAADAREDEEHFDKYLRAEFDGIKVTLGLPADLQPTFKTFISFGQVKY